MQLSPFGQDAVLHIIKECDEPWTIEKQARLYCIVWT